MAIPSATTAALRTAFDLPATALTEAELIDWLTAKIGEMMRLRPEYLMSLCYTLDLDEDAVAGALSPNPNASDPPFRILARLLFARQVDRARSKQAIAVPPLDDPNAW